MILRILFLIVIVGFFLSACSGDSTQIVQNTQVKKKASSKTDEILALEEKDYEEVYEYDPSGLRDPFVALIQEKKVEAKQVPAQPTGPLEPLQNYEISKIALIGVILGMTEPKAMVSTPDGKSFIVKKGSKIGRNNGVVSVIDTIGVHIEETYIDFSGKTRSSTKSIELPKREGGK